MRKLTFPMLGLPHQRRTRHRAVAGPLGHSRRWWLASQRRAQSRTPVALVLIVISRGRRFPQGQGGAGGLVARAVDGEAADAIRP